MVYLHAQRTLTKLYIYVYTTQYRHKKYTHNTMNIVYIHVLDAIYISYIHLP